MPPHMHPNLNRGGVGEEGEQSLGGMVVKAGVVLAGLDPLVFDKPE